MVKKKRQSKRQTLKDKYKIQKKVKEHHRKAKRESRRRAQMGLVKPKKKPLGLPNLMPYKEKFIQRMVEDRERSKARELTRLQRLNEIRRQEATGNEYDDEMALDDSVDSKKRKRSSGPSEEDLANVEQRAQAFEEKQMEDAASSSSSGVNTKKRMYMKELRNVVEASDVVLLVLDARDPMGCRAPQAERMVLENARNNKRLIVILNKIDLVPKTIVERWLTELRKEFPTVAFRASTQEQKSHLGRASKDSIALGTSGATTTIGNSVCVGADTLLQLLKNYSRNKDMKTSISVGVIGYPNVGKSSVINSLKRTRAVGVSSTAGFTKSLQVVQLDKKVKLIDSPGVLFHDGSDHKTSHNLVLRNALSPTDIDDPITPVLKLVERCSSEQLMLLYKIPFFKTPSAFLSEVARQRGKLSKGGVPDQLAAARLVLQDWNAGKIPYFVSPPKESTRKAESKIVTEWAKEFDLDMLMKKNESELVEHLPSDKMMDPEDCVVVFNKSVKL